MEGVRIVPLLALGLGAVGVVALVTSPDVTPLRAGPDPVRGVTDGASGSEFVLDATVPDPAASREALVEANAPEAPDGTGADGEAPVPRPAPTMAELREFRAYVRDTLREFRSAEAAEQIAGIEERIGNIDQTVAHFTDKVDLTPDQQDLLRTWVLENLERQKEYVRLWESGADEEALTELKLRDANEHLAALKVGLDRETLRAVLGLE